MLGTAKGRVRIRVVRAAVEAPVLANEEEEPRRRHRKVGWQLLHWRAGGNASLGRHRGLIPTRVSAI